MKLRDLFKRSKDNENVGKSSLGRMLDKDGFYIIMFICVCVVGISAVWVAKSNVDRYTQEPTPPENRAIVEADLVPRNVETDQSVVVIGKEDKVDESKQTTDKPTKKVVDHGKVLVENTTDEEVLEVAAVEEPNLAVLIWPVKGDIGMDYAVETLTYSSTLDHYTTHHGIDILAELQTPVKAALDGEVIEILSDSRLGLTISLKHDNGLITRYSNLSTDAMVNLGDIVAQGQTISGVGDSSIFESGEGPHLHFEVLIEKESVNPYEYFAKN